MNKEPLMLAVLQYLAQRHPSIGDGRGKGLMIGFEHGLLLLGCGVSTLRLIPPLIINRGQIEGDWQSLRTR